jgi:uncharacterized protein (TIGR03086 family)
MTTTADESPYFPATAPAELADAGTAVALIEPVLGQLADVVTRTTPETLAGPTPCERYDVAELRDHVLGWLQFFAAAFADPRRTRPRPEPDAYRAADDERDLADVVRESAVTISDAVRGDVLDGQVVLAQSRMDGPAAFAMVLGEYLVHGWDLAVAVGAPWTPPERACEMALEFFQGMILPEYRGGEGGFFGEEVPVPPDAPALERLLGFAGRRPRWQESSRSAPDVHVG